MIAFFVTTALTLLPTAPCRSNTTGCVIEADVGSGRVPLIVDTGADLTVLTQAGADRAGARWDKSSPLIAMQGVGGASVGYLSRIAIKIDGHKEEEILVVIAPSLRLERADGLLGMSYLERFKTNMSGGKLSLVPIDQGEEPRHGGRGQSWWSLRFQGNKRRLEQYDQALPAAMKADDASEAEIGSDPSRMKREEFVRRLRDFMQKEAEDLATNAARHSVPLEWRR